MVRSLAALVPTFAVVCSGLFFSLVAWGHWRHQHQSDQQPLDGIFDERLLRALLLLGGVMLALFIIYALFGIP